MGIPDDAETARSYGVTGLQPAFSPLYLPGPADRALGFWPFGPGEGRALMLRVVNEQLADFQPVVFLLRPTPPCGPGF
jgi:hypothetical protein